MSESIKGEIQTLTDILKAREQRVQYYQNLIKLYNYPVVSYKLNIPGPIKTNPLIINIFEEGLSRLNNNLKQSSIEVIFEKSFYNNSGPEHFIAFNGSPAFIKKITTLIEETNPLGRIFDFDIIDVNGSQISREDIGGKPRKCLICEKNAFECGRSRSHEIHELNEKIKTMAMNFFK